VKALTSAGSCGNDSPKLLGELNSLIASYGAPGSASRNMALRKYLQSTKFVKSATSEAELKKFRSLIELFRKYGQQYDMDFLLMLAQGYQESQLDNNAEEPRRRHWRHANHAGHRRGAQSRRHQASRGERQRRREVHAEDDRHVLQRRRHGPAEQRSDGLCLVQRRPRQNPKPAKGSRTRGLNPNIWFGNVERVVGEKIGRETVTYVSNIYKYYVAYSLTMEELKERAAAKATGD
jgi:hypothetical protein